MAAVVRGRGRSRGPVRTERATRRGRHGDRGDRGDRGGRGDQGALDAAAAFDTRAERVLELFARQAAILLANTLTLADARRTNTQLTDALQNRDVIGQAKRILLARGAADDRAAFAMLITASQRSNLKLRVVARQLASTVTSRETASAG